MIGVRLARGHLAEEQEVRLGIDLEHFHQEVRAELAAQAENEHVAVEDVGERMDGVVVGDESAFRLRRADRDDASHRQTSMSTPLGVRMAWGACEKMSYERESSVMVPLSVTSSDPYRVGLHAVR